MVLGAAMVGLGASTRDVVVMPGVSDSTKVLVVAEQKAFLPGGQTGASSVVSSMPPVPEQKMRVVRKSDRKSRIV